MSKKKNMLRIGTILCILLFLLIPLLSLPVAAAHTVHLGSVWTDNLPACPTAGGTIGGGVPAQITDTSPFNARYTVDYSYSDSKPGGTLGSDHWMEVVVSWTGPSPGSITFTQGVTRITPGGATVTGTYTTRWIIGYGGKTTVFSVYVNVYCLDRDTQNCCQWTSSTVVYTII